ncbi:MAG: SPOR domain-containing protein [Steroidobacterales bacterium]
MDTPSKERLVGAIIFVGLIVLVVPEILSGPHHFTSPATAPAATPTRSYVIELGNPVKPAGRAGPDVKPGALPPPPPAPGAQQLPTVAPPAPPPADPAPTVDPAPAKSAVMATPANDEEGWGAQLGSFAKAENAQRLVATLRKKGYHAFVSPTGRGSHVLHRVRVGPEASREAADALIVRLKRDGETATVVSLP